MTNPSVTICICSKCIENMRQFLNFEFAYSEYVKICSYHAENKIYKINIEDPFLGIWSILEKNGYISTMENLYEVKAKPNKSETLISEENVIFKLYCIDSENHSGVVLA
jgi:hypothetical protein